MEMQLKGEYQQKNARTILTAIDVLREEGYTISDEAISEGFAHVCDMTGLMGRWQQVHQSPVAVCDIGHNPAGLHEVIHQIGCQHCQTLRIVIGFVNDKDIRPALSTLPSNAEYYFTAPSVSRALSQHTLSAMARCYGLQGRTFDSVSEAYGQALKESAPDDFIFVGGSNFVVADLLSGLE